MAHDLPRGNWGASLAILPVFAIAITFYRAQADAPCQPYWVEGWAYGQVNGKVRALTVFDDGSGTALFSGGSFTTAGGLTVNRIAKWDGTGWEAMAGGFTYPTAPTPYVTSLLAAQTGTNRSLYVGGLISRPNQSFGIFRWTGTGWAQLAGGLNGIPFALAEFDDGTGPALYVGGSFTNAGGTASANITKWNGTTWSTLKAGTGGATGSQTVYALCVFDDGTGPALYAGGNFTTVDGKSASRIAKWDGSAWSTLGSGLNETVWALAVFDDGTGPALYAAGDFTQAGSQPANRIARWDGTNWSALGTGLSGGARALCVFDDGGGPALYVGGLFDQAGSQTSHKVARWNGTEWSTANVPATGANVYALSGYDDGHGARLLSGTENGIQRWTGDRWEAFTLNGVDSDPLALETFDDGRGMAVFVGGRHDLAGTQVIPALSRWDGRNWSALGAGFPTTDTVFALGIHDEGHGKALYAGGLLRSAGDVTVRNIAKWNGQTWSAVGEGLYATSTSGAVNCLLSADIGEGRCLYAGGWFTQSGSTPLNHIARWDGTRWSPLGEGLDDFSICMKVYEVQGQGNLLVGGGFWKAGGQPCKYLARWDGTNWNTFGEQPNGPVTGLVEFDDGSGKSLYACGSFTTMGSTSVLRVARWNGNGWSQVGAGFNDKVATLRVFNDGTGPALFAGGSFTSSGTTPTPYFAKWNGSAWVAVTPSPNGQIYHLTPFLKDGKQSLIVAGTFSRTGAIGASNIGQWVGCAHQPGDFDGDGMVDGQDLQYFLACAAGAEVPYDLIAPAPGCTLTPDAQGFLPADLDTDGDIDQDDFGLFQRCLAHLSEGADSNCLE